MYSPILSNKSSNNKTLKQIFLNKRSFLTNIYYTLNEIPFLILVYSHIVMYYDEIAIYLNFLRLKGSKKKRQAI